MGNRPQERELHDLIGLIYEAGVHPARWSEPLSRIAELSSARSAVLVRGDWESMELGFFAVDRADPDWLAMTPHYLPLCPFLPAFLQSARAGTAYVSEAYVPAFDLRRTEYYNDFLRPHEMDHMGGIWIDRQAHSLITNLDLQRPSSLGPFGEDELALLRHLVGHVRRALQLSLRTLRWESETMAGAQALAGLPVGAALLDAAGRLIYANVHGEALLSGGRGLRVRGGQLQAVQADEDAALQRLIGGAVATGNGRGFASGGALAVTRGDGSTPLQLLVSPLNGHGPAALSVPGRACALVLLSQPEQPSPLNAELLCLLYGLTPAEARLAGALADGEDLSAIAERFGITRSTARSQLKAVMDKTGARRQAGLVRLLLRGPAGLGANGNGAS